MAIETWLVTSADGATRDVRGDLHATSPADTYRLVKLGIETPTRVMWARSPIEVGDTIELAGERWTCWSCEEKQLFAPDRFFVACFARRA